MPITNRSLAGSIAVPGLYFVYNLASRRNGTLYVGSTNDLVRRVFEHRTKAVPGFTSRYNVTRLVHYQQLGELSAAIQRERNIKHWSRAWKIALVERENPDWRDLFEEIAT